MHKQSYVNLSSSFHCNIDTITGRFLCPCITVDIFKKCSDLFSLFMQYIKMIDSQSLELICRYCSLTHTINYVVTVCVCVSKYIKYGCQNRNKNRNKEYLKLSICKCDGI